MGESRPPRVLLAALVLAALAALGLLAWTLSTGDDAPAGAESAPAAATEATTPRAPPRRRARTTKDGRPILLVMVVAENGGAPVEGASVTLETPGSAGAATTTDAEGVAAVVLPDGTEFKSVLVAKTGFRQERRVVGRDPPDLLVSLAADDAAPTAPLRVTSASPLPEGATVRLENAAGGDVMRPIAVQENGATLNIPGPGAWDLTVFGPSSVEAGWEIRRKIDAGRDAAVEIPYDPGPRIMGRVIDVEGRPVAEALVAFESASGDVRRKSWTRADRDGAFSLPALAHDVGTLRVGTLANRGHMSKEDVRRARAEASPQSHRLVPAELKDVTPDGAPVLVTLHRFARLLGRVTPPGPRAAVLIVRTVATAPADRTTVVIDQRGAFECESPAHADPLRLWFCAYGFAPAAIDAPAVRPDETCDLGAIALDPGVTIDIALVDADGAALAFRHVDALESWPSGTGTATDEDGRVRFERVPRGPLRLAFSAWRTTPRTIFVIDDAASPPGRLVVGPGAAVSGRLAAGGADVEVAFRLAGLPDDDDDAESRVKPDASGLYSVRLQSGRHRVRLRVGGERVECQPAEIVVADGETRTLDLRAR